MARELRYYGLCARLVIHSCVEDEAVVKTRPSARDEASGCAVSAEGGEVERIARRHASWQLRRINNTTTHKEIVHTRTREDRAPNFRGQERRQKCGRCMHRRHTQHNRHWEVEESTYHSTTGYQDIIVQQSSSVYCHGDGIVWFDVNHEER